MVNQQKESQSWIGQYWPDFNSFVADMTDARVSERVTVIIGSAMLDIVLRRLLAAFMVDDAAVVDRVLGKEGSGGQMPLSTFSSRINICYALGLINNNERRALDYVREIRNAFAHKLSDNISEQSISDITINAARLALPTMAHEVLEGMQRQDMIRSAIVTLTLTLVARIKQTVPFKRIIYNGEIVTIWALEEKNSDSQ